jgi:hypothetical protein
VIGVAPDHVPVSADSVWPTVAVPLIEGRTALLGACAAAPTAPLVDDDAVPLPSAFVAVTCTRTEWSMSAVVSAKLCFVAAPMSTQLPPPDAQRCH